MIVTNLYYLFLIPVAIFIRFNFDKLIVSLNFQHSITSSPPIQETNYKLQKLHERLDKNTFYN